MSEIAPVTIERARPGDAAGAAGMIEAVFARDIAPGMSSVGRVAFRLYVTEKALRLRLAQGAVAWCARHVEAGVAGPLLGYVELRGRDGRVDGVDHLSLLFVAIDHQRRGLARRLLATVSGYLRKARRPVTELSVQAAPSAVPIYQRLGFRTIDLGETFADQPGMPLPMRLVLDASATAKG